MKEDFKAARERFRSLSFRRIFGGPNETWYRLFIGRRIRAVFPASHFSCHSNVTWPSTPVASSSTDFSMESCNVCGGTEADGLVGIGPGLMMIDTEIDWIQYNSCDLWYHRLCLKINDADDIGDEYYCPSC